MSGLEELRRLEGAATPGPWRYNPRKVWYQDKGKLAAARMGNPFITGGEEFVGAGPDDGSNETTIGIATTGPADDPESMANAEFIAAARNQLPRILDALDAVERVRKELFDWLNHKGALKDSSPSEYEQGFRHALDAIGGFIDDLEKGAGHE